MNSIRTPEKSNRLSLSRSTDASPTASPKTVKDRFSRREKTIHLLFVFSFLKFEFRSPISRVRFGPPRTRHKRSRIRPVRCQQTVSKLSRAPINADGQRLTRSVSTPRLFEQFQLRSIASLPTTETSVGTDDGQLSQRFGRSSIQFASNSLRARFEHTTTQPERSSNIAATL